MTNAEAKNVGIALKASIASRINAAFHANSVPTIAEIEIINDTEEGGMWTGFPLARVGQ
jgi:hypothetical protein